MKPEIRTTEKLTPTWVGATFLAALAALAGCGGSGENSTPAVPVAAPAAAVVVQAVVAPAEVVPEVVAPAIPVASAPVVPASAPPGTGSLVVTASAAAAQPQFNNSTLAVISATGGPQLQMVTGTTTTTAGTYVGGGVGNKAILQVAGFDGLKITDLDSVQLETLTTAYSSGDGPYINLLVDLDCVKNEDALPAATLGDLRAGRRMLVLNFSQMPPAGITATSDGFSRYSIDRSTPVWNIGGASGLGLIGNPSAPQRALTAFDSATYPNACIVDARSGDAGLFRDRGADPSCNTTAALGATDKAVCSAPSLGLLLAVGGSGNVQPFDSRIRSLKVNTRTITFSP